MTRRLAVVGLAALAAVSLCPDAALGAPPAWLAVEPKAGVVVLGHKRPTGGLSAGLSLKFRTDTSASTGAYAAAGVDLIDIPGGWYGMGVIAGPRVGAWQRWGKFEFAGSFGLPYGQLQTCRPWADVYKQCVRWWNAWEELAVRASYAGEDLRVGVELTGLYLDLPWGDTVGGGVAAVGSFW